MVQRCPVWLLLIVIQWHSFPLFIYFTDIIVIVLTSSQNRFDIIPYTISFIFTRMPLVWSLGYYYPVIHFEMLYVTLCYKQFVIFQLDLLQNQIVFVFFFFTLISEPPFSAGICLMPLQDIRSVPSLTVWILFLMPHLLMQKQARE